MKTGSYIILALSLFVSACSQTSFKEAPENVIPHDQMVNILIDIHITDALLKDLRMHDRDLKDSTLSYYNHLFLKHQITRKQLEESIDYYSFNTQEFSSLYKQVVDTIRQRSAELADSTETTEDVLFIK